MDRLDIMAHDHTIKHSIIGDKGCGKSCLLHQFTGHKCMSCLLSSRPAPNFVCNDRNDCLGVHHGFLAD